MFRSISPLTALFVLSALLSEGASGGAMQEREVREAIEKRIRCRA